MASAVLDSSAVLAVLNDEPGSPAVIALLDDAIMSAVNYAEVISKLVERGAAPGHARAMVRTIDVAIVDFDRSMADRVGELRSTTKSLGLSLGDRACISLAEREGAPALTSDRRWAEARCDAEIRVIR